MTGVRCSDSRISRFWASSAPIFLLNSRAIFSQWRSSCRTSPSAQATIVVAPQPSEGNVNGNISRKIQNEKLPDRSRPCSAPRSAGRLAMHSPGSGSVFRSRNRPPASALERVRSEPIESASESARRVDRSRRCARRCRFRSTGPSNRSA